jgi:hydrogenase/urease accessory protein HupE
VTPRLASRHLVIPGRAVGVSREHGRWRWFAGALFAAGAATGSALILSGQPLPRAASVVVLAVFMAFAVNRYAFFPTELAVTA